MNASLRLAIERLRSGSLSTRQFVAVWRNETGPLLAELPSRYAQVLDSILMRLESSALFSEESCSFSRAELIDNLALWLDKAEGYVSGLRRQGEQKP